MGKAAEALTLKQARALMGYLVGIGRLDHVALVAVLAGCGLRIGDALALRWSDLRDADGWREQVTVREKKTGKTRLVPLLPWVREALSSWWENTPAQELSSHVFVSIYGRAGQSVSRQAAWKALRKAASDLGIRGSVAPHSFRKAFATAVFDASGHDPVLAARVTGHSNPAQLLHYIRRQPAAETSVWAALAGQGR